MRTRYFALALLVSAAFVPPAAAHHPGADLDKVMGSKERYFQTIDKPAPPFGLVDTGAKAVALSDYSEKVVILHFVYARCPDICPLHTTKLAEIQRTIDRTPMKDRVRFIGITTDPANDTPDLLKAYGFSRGLDPENAALLTTRSGQGEGATRTLAEAYGHKFVESGEGYQTHSIVTHIIDRNGRWAANFHGLKFEPVNMVLYVNGLLNNAHSPGKKPEPGWWEKIERLFD